MTPVAHTKRWLKDLREGSRYAWLWTMTVTATLVAAGALILAPFLFTRLNDAQNSTEHAVAQTRALTCALGDLVQLGSGPRRAAVEGPTFHLRAELNFLQTILAANCPIVQSQSAIHNEVVKTIQIIERELQRRAEEGP